MSETAHNPETDIPAIQPVPFDFLSGRPEMLHIPHPEADQAPVISPWNFENGTPIVIAPFYDLEDPSIQAKLEFNREGKQVVRPAEVVTSEVEPTGFSRVAESLRNEVAFASKRFSEARARAAVAAKELWEKATPPAREPIKVIPPAPKPAPTPEAPQPAPQPARPNTASVPVTPKESLFKRVLKDITPQTPQIFSEIADGARVAKNELLGMVRDFRSSRADKKASRSVAAVVRPQQVMPTVVAGSPKAVLASTESIADVVSRSVENFGARLAHLKERHPFKSKKNAQFELGRTLIKLGEARAKGLLGVKDQSKTIFKLEAQRNELITQVLTEIEALEDDTKTLEERAGELAIKITQKTAEAERKRYANSKQRAAIAWMSRQKLPVKMVASAAVGVPTAMVAVSAGAGLIGGAVGIGAAVFLKGSVGSYRGYVSRRAKSKVISKDLINEHFTILSEERADRVRHEFTKRRIISSGMHAKQAVLSAIEAAEYEGEVYRPDDAIRIQSGRICTNNDQRLEVALAEQAEARAHLQKALAWGLGTAGVFSAVGWAASTFDFNPVENVREFIDHQFSSSRDQLSVLRPRSNTVPHQPPTGTTLPESPSTTVPVPGDSSPAPIPQQQVNPWAPRYTPTPEQWEAWNSSSITYQQRESMLGGFAKILEQHPNATQAEIDAIATNTFKLAA